jgi:hypothetical protein
MRQIDGRLDEAAVYPRAAEKSALMLMTTLLRDRRSESRRHHDDGPIVTCTTTSCAIMRALQLDQCTRGSIRPFYL